MTSPPETHSFEDAGGIPNSRLAVFVYHGVEGAREGRRLSQRDALDPRRGDPAEREEVLANIKAVPLPDADPVQGPNGPLTELWRATTSEAAAGGSPGSWTNRSSSGRS